MIDNRMQFVKSLTDPEITILKLCACFQLSHHFVSTKAGEMVGLGTKENYIRVNLT